MEHLPGEKLASSQRDYQNELPRGESCEVSTRLRTAMARQFGGVELVYLVSVFPRTLEQPQLDVLAMQLRIAFVTALLSYICAKAEASFEESDPRD